MRFLLIPVIGLFAVAPVRAQEPLLRLTDEDGAATVSGTIIDGAAAFPVDALVRLGADIDEDVAGLRAVLFGDTLSFMIGSPWFHSRTGVQQLAFPVRRIGATVYLPEQFFLQWLPQRFPQQLAWRAGALRSSVRLAGSERATPVPVQRVVVIDPGHGGRDAGKVGPNGLAEKDVVLAIGLRLAELLGERGYEVHLTRNRDTLIALGDRPRLANDWKGTRQRAVFVSIHANSWRSSVRGYETYFLSDARTDDARRVAEMENAAQEYEDGGDAGLGEADLILNSLRNDFYVRASNDLAEVVQRSLSDFHPGPDRGVKQAGFRVLVGALMPAVLVETAYMSNPQEARMLGTSSFQQKLAYGIADAIDRFFEQHEHLWSAGSP